MSARRLAFLATVMILNNATPAIAQVVIGGYPRAASTAVVKPGAKPTPPQGGMLSHIGSAFSDQRPLFKFRQVTVRPHFAYSIVHGDGILRVPGQPADTIMQTFSPGVLVELGQYVTVDYSWTRRSYSTSLLSNTSDHNLRAEGGHTWRNLGISLAHSYGSNSPTLVETGMQTHEETHSSIVGLSYRLGKRSSVESLLSRRARIADPYIKSETWTGSDWVQWSATNTFRYEVSRKLDLGVGFISGYDEISGGPDMKYTQPLLQIGWRPIEKIALNANAGVETRQSLAQGAQADSNTVYDIGVRYSPGKTTSLSLGRHVSVSTSYFANRSTKSTGWDVAINQRLFGKAHATATASNGLISYLRNEDLSTAGRDDEFSSLSVAIGSAVFRRGSISLTYAVSENRSKESGYSFRSHQLVLDLAFRF